MEAQGYKVSDSIVYQKNESAIRLKQNRKGSSSKCTWHIDICYFFITDCIEAGDLTMEYCPTGMMIGDFYTKAMQGKTFRMFRDLIMNVENQLPGDVPFLPETRLSAKTLSTSSRVSPQECVGENVIKSSMTRKAVCRNAHKIVSGLRATQYNHEIKNKDKG
eukprot:3338152-Ditylum_brightwellii.AAC.1